jgi:hypothetical protein
VRHPAGLLHANFVVALLSDLFGIQARSGCFCAGPYIHRMYPIDDLWSRRMDAEVAKGHMGAKLAFTRLSFNYFITETVFRYIVDAVHLIAEEGGSCWRCTASTRTPGCGSIAPARPTRRRACAPSPPPSMARRRAWPPRPRACSPASSRLRAR